MHTEQEKLSAAIAEMTKQGWAPEYDNGEPLLLSEGHLAVACFNAGYAMHAQPAPLADAALTELERLFQEYKTAPAWGTNYAKAAVEALPGLLARLRAAEAKVADLLENGSPGVMHKIDKGFYDLAHKELNYERQKNDRLTKELKTVKGGQPNA